MMSKFVYHPLIKVLWDIKKGVKKRDYDSFPPVVIVPNMVYLVNLFVYFLESSGLIYSWAVSNKDKNFLEVYLKESSAVGLYIYDIYEITKSLRNRRANFSEVKRLALKSFRWNMTRKNNHFDDLLSFYIILTRNDGFQLDCIAALNNLDGYVMCRINMGRSSTSFFLINAEPELINTNDQFFSLSDKDATKFIRPIFTIDFLCDEYMYSLGIFSENLHSHELYDILRLCWHNRRPAYEIFWSVLIEVGKILKEKNIHKFTVKDRELLTALFLAYNYRGLYQYLFDNKKLDWLLSRIIVKRFCNRFLTT